MLQQQSEGKCLQTPKIWHGAKWVKSPTKVKARAKNKVIPASAGNSSYMHHAALLDLLLLTQLFKQLKWKIKRWRSDNYQRATAPKMTQVISVHVYASRMNSAQITQMAYQLLPLSMKLVRMSAQGNPQYKISSQEHILLVHSINKALYSDTNMA